jgi:hypothetical protein
MLNEGHPNRPDVFSEIPDLKAQFRFLQHELNSIRRYSIKLHDEIPSVKGSRLLFQKGQLRVDPYHDQITRLTANKGLSSKLLEELSVYEQQWSEIRYRSHGQSRREQVNSILKRHPHVQQIRGIYAIPLVVLMDIANQSDIGLYTQSTPRVTSLSLMDTAFTTLSHNDYWRRMMGRHGVLIAERFAKKSIPFDLVMVGDGSGDLGVDMAKALEEAHFDFRLIHLDIGDGALEQQQKSYMKAGIPNDRLVGIKCSVTEAGTAIRKAVPDFKGGYFVLHEVLDALRTHSLLSDIYGGIRELYQIIGLPDNPYELQAFEPTNDLVRRVANYFPLYQPVKSDARMIPFSPAWLSCIREILSSGEHIAIYIGDYGGQFVMGEATNTAYEELPMRVYGKGIVDKHKYTQVFEREVDMTTDVLPSIVYVASLFGGEVEYLLTQEQYLTLVDTELPKAIPVELARIETATQNDAYKEGDEVRFLQDELYATQICSPLGFGSLITKGL